MASTYYIKAYYTKQNQQQPEIRRFAIDISPENDVFHELQTKIASFQPDNQLKNFILQYNDEENEHITFSSNDELRSAISLNKDGSFLKVFVTFIEQQDNSTNKECHVGVTCDGCQGSVVGFRYKCFVCPNYDLCEKCSSAGIHSEHNMIKITKPGNFSHDHFHHHRHHHGPPHPPPPPLPPHPHPLPPHPYPPPPPPPHPHPLPPHPYPPPPPPPFFPNREFLAQIQSQIPQWLPNRENTAHLRTHIQHHLDSLKAHTQTHMQNSKQYLESVGQYLQQELSSFGIDCDYHVDEKQSATDQQQQQQQQDEEQISTTSQQQENQTSTTNQQQEEQVSTNDTVPTPEPGAVPKYPNLIQEQTASSSTPLVEESTKITNPLEKAIDDCVERMKGMGFTDVNGALRELIRSKKGDINLVLDAINPRHH